MKGSRINERWVYLNGQFVRHQNAKISVFDRGFLFGDSVYENIPVYFRKPRKLDWHLERLENSLLKIHITIDISAFNLKTVIFDLINRHDDEHQSVYLQISRGQYSTRCHALPNVITPTIVIFTKPLTLPTIDSLSNGYQLITAEDIRWRYTSIKTTNLLPNILQLHQAIVHNAEEAILIRDQQVIEGTCSNIFLVKNGVVLTPPEQNGMLSGITRKIVLNLLNEHSISYVERAISKHELYVANELWFTNSIDGIAPISHLDKQPIGSGKSGPLWKKIYNSYLNYLQNEAVHLCEQ